MKILIVDDEPLARQLLRRMLASIDGARVVGECADGPEAVTAILAETPDVVLLDIQMRTTDGFGVIEAVGVDRMPPTIFVTAHDAYALRAFDVHAVDYLLKPVRPEQLRRALERATARRGSGDAGLRDEVRQLVQTMRTLMAERSGELSTAQRSSSTETGDAPATTLSFGDVVVDLRAHSVSRGGAEVPLSPRAYALLTALIDRAGGVVRRGELLRDIWGYSPDVASRTLDMHVMDLRRKLEPDPAKPRYIITVRKTGYRFNASQLRR